MADTAASPNNVSVKFKGKKAMAKSKSTGAPAAAIAEKPDRDWEAEDALRTMQRAGEHEGDPAMMKRVAKHAKQQSDGLATVMERLRKQGLVSDKQAKKTAQRVASSKAPRA